MPCTLQTSRRCRAYLCLFSCLQSACSSRLASGQLSFQDVAAVAFACRGHADLGVDDLALPPERNKGGNAAAHIRRALHLNDADFVSFKVPMWHRGRRVLQDLPFCLPHERWRPGASRNCKLLLQFHAHVACPRTCRAFGPPGAASRPSALLPRGGDELAQEILQRPSIQQLEVARCLRRRLALWRRMWCTVRGTW